MYKFYIDVQSKELKSVQTYKNVNTRAVVDSSNIALSTHIFKYRYIDTHFSISILGLKLSN